MKGTLHKAQQTNNQHSAIVGTDNYWEVLVGKTLGGRASQA